jgi:hypothetical protein
MDEQRPQRGTAIGWVGPRWSTAASVAVELTDETERLHAQVWQTSAELDDHIAAGAQARGRAGAGQGLQMVAATRTRWRC